tara:strand:- start:348 stop:737 length:390 start_codon:yes stop_codon:yes gene_type:complete
MSALLGGLGQIALPVRDLEASMPFYAKTLGLRVLMQPPGMAFFDLVGVRLMIQEMETVESSSTVLYFRVEDIEAAYSDLTARGVSFMDKPHVIAQLDDHTLWMAFFQDPDDHPLALMAEVPYDADQPRG